MSGFLINCQFSLKRGGHHTHVCQRSLFLGSNFLQLFWLGWLNLPVKPKQAWHKWRMLTGWLNQLINQALTHSPNSTPTSFHLLFHHSFIHSFSQSVNQLVWQSFCYSQSASKSAHLSQSVSQSLLSISQTVKYCLRQSVIKGLSALGWLGMSVSRTQSVVLSQSVSHSHSTK